VQKDFCNNIGTTRTQANGAECPQLAEADTDRIAQLENVGFQFLSLRHSCPQAVQTTNIFPDILLVPSRLGAFRSFCVERLRTLTIICWLSNPIQDACELGPLEGKTRTGSTTKWFCRSDAQLLTKITDVIPKKLCRLEKAIAAQPTDRATVALSGKAATHQRRKVGNGSGTDEEEACRTAAVDKTRRAGAERPLQKQVAGQNGRPRDEAHSGCIATKGFQFWYIPRSSQVKQTQKEALVLSAAERSCRTAAVLGGSMKKAKKRTSAKSSSKRAAAKLSKRGSTKPKRTAKTKKRSAGITRSKVKGTAKKAAKAAVIAAGLAAVDTVLTELGPGEKKPSGGQTGNEEKR
jgi:hypothetical protein